MSKQDGAKPTQNTTQAGGTAPTNIVNSTLANASMPLIHTGHPTPDNTGNRRMWGTGRVAMNHDIDRDQGTWLDHGTVTIRAGGWLNSPSPKKLRRVAGP